MLLRFRLLSQSQIDSYLVGLRLEFREGLCMEMEAEGAFDWTGPLEGLRGRVYEFTC